MEHCYIKQGIDNFYDAHKDFNVTYLIIYLLLHRRLDIKNEYVLKILSIEYPLSIFMHLNAVTILHVKGYVSDKVEMINLASSVITLFKLIVYRVRSYVKLSERSKETIGY